MKSHALVVAVLAFAFIYVSAGYAQQSAEQLYQSALYKEEIKGELNDAIKIYEKIINDYPENRSVASKAQLHIGLCYEKSGLKEAQKAYRKVIDSYPEQTEAVRAANEKLSLLLRAEAVIRKEDKAFNIRQVWAGPDVDTYGTPSPDGRYLSYTDWETGDLAIRELATGKTRRLTKKGTQKEPAVFALNSVISPDNKLVAYSWTNEYGMYDLCLIGIDGSGNRILYNSKDKDEVYPASWSSDGKQIAARRYGEKAEIISIAVADGSIQVLKTFENFFWSRFCYSPDDRFIAYDFPVAENSGYHDISLISTDGSGEISLIEHPANDRLLGWTPGRKEILFLSDRSGTWDAWIIQVANGKPLGAPKRIKPDLGQVSPMAFTQNGSFYFSIYTRKFTTEVAPFDLKTGKVQEQLSKPLLGSNFSAEWSPDGEYLAYVTEQTKPAGPGWYHRPLHVLNLGTGEEQELAGDFEVRFPRWSPDGRSILFTGHDNNRSNQKDDDYNGGVYKIVVQTGNVTELVKFPPSQDWGWDFWTRSIADWSHDGKSVFYVNRGRIFMRELESGREKQLYQNNNLARFLDLSPDGKRLIFVTENSDEGTWSILTMPVSGGEPRELCKFFQESEESEGIGFITWTPDGKYVLFTENTKKVSVLWRISPEGGEPQKLKLWQSDNRYSGLSIHPDGQQIAFSTSEQEHEVWVMKNFLPEEKEDKAFNIRKVWAVTEEHIFGAPSPDGRYLSYTDYSTGDLAIYEIATGKKSHLTNEGSWDEPIEYVELSGWSPDGKQIVYDWYKPNNENGFIDLRIIGLDGSKPRILYSNKEVVYANTYDWSTDGTKILACFERKDGTRQIVLVSAENGSVRVLKTLVGKKWPAWPGNMSFSPDGRYIVYDFPTVPTEEYSPESDIFLLSTDGGHEISLVDHPADDKLLGWAPDGKNILFASDRTGTFDAFVIQVADGKPHGSPELIKKGIGRMRPKGFTQKGSFYYSISHDERDVYITTLDPDTGKILAPPEKAIKRFEGSNDEPIYSPDGKYMAYISNRSHRDIICIRSLETGQEREFSFNLINIISANSLSWSPDCRSILVIGRDNKLRRGIFQIHLQTGDVTPILARDFWKSIFIHSGEWARDGKAIFYVRSNQTGNNSQILVRDLETGTEKELYRSDDYLNISLSPDGQWLACSHPRSLKVMPVTGGEPRELYRFEEEYRRERPISWTADGKYILFSRKEQDGWDLCRIPAEGGEPEKLGLEMVNFFYLSVHPDGRHIAFSSPGSTPPIHEVWVMENFLPE